MRWRELLLAALAYTAAIFALGVLLGVVRTLWLAPLLGPLPAVALELPVMLAASWLWCRRLLRPKRFVAAEALALGAVAFALLLLAELRVSIGLAGRDLAAHLALYRLPEAQLGLAAQALFALMPWFKRQHKRTSA